jgi:hypothetical protein
MADYEETILGLGTPQVTYQMESLKNAGSVLLIWAGHTREEPSGELTYAPVAPCVITLDNDVAQSLSDLYGLTYQSIDIQWSQTWIPDQGGGFVPPGLPENPPSPKD